jgi:hypothetical protein
MASDLAATMFLQIGATRYQVASFAQASAMFCAARDRHGEGASKTPSPEIVTEAGTVIATVSFNGRVWPPGAWTPTTAPIYDNSADSIGARLTP